MWCVTVAESESGTEILPGHGVFLQGSHNWGVNSLLEGLSSISNGFLFGSFGEELLGSGSLGDSFSSEASVSDSGDITDGNLGAGAHGVDLVDSSDWDTVDLEWSSDGKKAGGELLEADDSLSSESTSEEDKHGTWGDTGSELGSLLSWVLSSLW